MNELFFSSIKLPYVAIGLTLLIALTPYKKTALGLLVTSIGLFFVNDSNLLDLTAILTLSLYASLFFFINHSNEKIFRVINALIIIFSFAIALAQVPTFISIIVEKYLQYSPDSISTSMVYSANKAFIGILLLCAIPLTRSKEYPIKRSFMVCITGLVTILSLAIFMGTIQWDPYWHWNTFNWIFDVLILTVIGEEVFFRYYIQGYLLSRLKISANSIVVSSALLFGIAHIGGGLEYFALASIAGFFYAYIYQKTNQILWPIALHFLVNLVHFLLFTYPNTLQV